MNQLKMNTNLLHLSFRSIHRGSCIRVRVHVCGDNRVIQPDYLVGKRKTDGRLLHQFYCYQYHHVSSIITTIIIGVAFSILGSCFFLFQRVVILFSVPRRNKVGVLGNTYAGEGKAVVRNGN